MADAETEKNASQPEAGNQRATLGIGTLIIIAIIVTMCSGGGEVDKIRSDTAEIKRRLDVIDRKLDALVTKSGATAPMNVEAAAAPTDVGGTPPETP